MSEIERIVTNIGKAYAACGNMGANMPEEQNFANLEGAIRTIQGSALPDNMCSITLVSSDLEGGNVSGRGAASKNMKVQIEASPASGYSFQGWQENGRIVSRDEHYLFTVEEDRELLAVFEAVKPSQLPEGYEELEWIESTSGSLINTNSRVSYDKTKIFVDMQFRDNFLPQRNYICFSNNTGSGTSTNQLFLSWYSLNQIGLTSYTASAVYYSVSPAGKRITLDLDYIMTALRVPPSTLMGNKRQGQRSKRPSTRNRCIYSTTRPQTKTRR